MRAVTTILLLILSGQPAVEQSYGQGKPENRYPLQSYIEDSAHVFWTWYPNPFSPPSIRDTGKGMICGGLSFYCDLSETVTVAFLKEKDSVVYEATIRLLQPPHFSLCYWLAGPQVDLHRLPSYYMRSDSSQEYRLLLLVHGRGKCVRESGIFVPQHWCCWIEGITRYKRRPGGAP